MKITNKLNDNNIQQYINSLNDDIDELNISYTYILTYIPNRNFKKLTNLLYHYNNLNSLPILSNNLLHLTCDNNNISYLPELPINLITLQCNHIYPNYQIQ